MQVSERFRAEPSHVIAFGTQKSETVRNNVLELKEPSSGNIEYQLA